MILRLQNEILEMIATGELLSETIARLCLRVEALVPDIVCSVLSVKAGRLHPLAGPSIPPHYSAAIDNVEIGPLAGSCGTAAFQKSVVTVTDIENDPRWHDYKGLALPLGFKACWSTPIMSGVDVVATFAFYYGVCRGPSQLEQRLVEACVHLCAIAIDRDERAAERYRLMYQDALTGLQNRARFNQVMAEMQSRSLDAGGILLADIDNLKIVNDTFGHTAGDALIRIVAKRISAIATPERTYRLGGDEFAVIIAADAPEKMAMLASAILAELKQPSDCADQVAVPQVTIGGAVAGTGDQLSQVLHNADIALYHAKAHYRGQYMEYFPQLRTALTRRITAVRDVTAALAEDRIDAHYQPIVRLDSREVVGFEALCRMTTVSGEVVAAAHFHEATRDARVAADLTQSMLLRVASDIRRWLDMGLPVQHVGINLSASDFHAGNLQERICTIFTDAGVPLKHIILEVTESVYLGHQDNMVAQQIATLRSKGLMVALDDFGTGFASLTHLLTVPVDIIKIDKSFVDRLSADQASAVIVESLMEIARKLGIRAVVEGIETELQAEHLRRLGCILGQGYLYSRAVDRTAATAMLERAGQQRHSPETRQRA